MAESEVLLVAPFIKHAGLEKLLAVTPDRVSVRCVTRWHPQEIAAGASDLEVWPILKNRSNSALWLRQNLHAKFYRFDDQCLIGSANITLSALGWKNPPNLELLVSCSAQHAGVLAFENDLFADAVLVNDAMYERTAAAVECLPKVPEATFSTEISTMILVAEENAAYSPVFHHNAWIPQLRHPEDLYKAYVGAWDRLSRISRKAAATDLEALMIPAGLDRNAFEAQVGAMLLQQPIVQDIDQLTITPQRFGAVKALLASRYENDPDFDPGQVWQSLMRWLLHFLPDRYGVSVPNYSEVFYRLGD